MASDIAPPPQLLPQHDEMDRASPPAAPSVLAATVNGEREPLSSGFEENGLVKGGEITANEDHIPPTDIDVAAPLQPSPSPVEQVNSGITPVADFIPKEAANVSHPTPPPDEPLITGSADIDVEMANVDADPQISVAPAIIPEPVVPPTEPSLVRPREDDDDDEPAAKRSRVEEIPAQLEVDEVVLPDVPILERAVEAEVAPAVEAETLPAIEDIVETIAQSEPEPELETAVEETFIPPVVEEPAVEPTVELTETMAEAPTEAAVEVEPAAESLPPATSSPIEQSVVDDVKMEEVKVEARPATPPVEPAQTEAIASAPVVQTPADTPAEPPAPASVLPQELIPQPSQKPTYSTAPITSLQKSSLLEKVKNLKKTKNSSAFLKPVDYVLLNIPTYPDIVKNPMDLTTMETKLKDGQYATVQDFADDFDLIISNVRRFNGDAHPITQAGLNMEAYFRRVMETVPSADQQTIAKPEKQSPSIATEKPKREPRVIPPPPPPAATQAEAFALQPDGTPQIRRQSSISNRPARAIKPPQSREIAYSKPKRKENQLELRFCEHILDELRGPKYATTNHVFMYPVDPVALNIPNYRSIVKVPMDMSTMSQKLRGGQYSNASEFKRDFDLIIENCLSFNPVGNPVRDIGIQFRRQFEELWQGKEKWERKNQPVSNRASSASADEESDAEEEEDEGNAAEDPQAATIRALQKQLAEMQNALSSFGEKPAKTKKAKGTKAPGKKSSGTAAAPARKIAPPPKQPVKAKKPKQVTYEEKQEISEAVGNMDEKQVSKLTDIITQNVAKYRDMDEMELEIDDLPNDVQVMLLEYVRKIFGNPNKKKAREPSPDDAAALDDDDYEERGGAKGSKRKKHKPMGKKEQQDTISNIKNKLAQFSAVTSGSESPTNAANAPVDTSGDEESEESEEE